MSKKLIKCKTCGSEIAKNAKTCPQCGAKNKKHPVLGALLIFLGICMILAAVGGSGDEPQQVGGAASSEVNQSAEVQSVVSAPVEPEEDVKTNFTVGDKVDLNDVAVTLVDVSENTGSDFMTPTEGNVFVLCEFEIENNSSGDITVSSMMSFEAYFDDYASNISVSAMALSDKNQLDGTVAAGKKMRGVVGYEAPADWSNMEIRFTPSFWSIRDIIFTASK